MTNMEKGLAKARARSANLRTVESAADHDPIRETAAAAPELVIVPELGLAGLEPALDIDKLPVVELDPLTLSDNRIVVDELTAASAAYKMLRTRVLQRMRRNNWKTLAVTGTCPDEGKSLTAINLSINLARDVGTSVVLVDMDLRKPSLHRHLGIKPRCGVGDYLRGGTPLDRIALRPGIDRLAVICNERPFPNSSEMLASPQTASLVDQLKQGDGRIAVFDMPPVLASDDMLAFCPQVDAVLLVLSQGKTRQADLVALRDLLQNVNVVGAVLNRAQEDIAPYYYYGHA